MVSPAIDMLSVFITPWMKPTRIQLRDQLGLARSTTCSSSARYGVSAAGRIRVVAGDDVVGERRIALDVLRAAKYWKVPTRMWLAATRVSTAPGSAVSR